MMEHWRIAGRIETCVGAARHWTGVLPRTLRALATDIEALRSDDELCIYKDGIDRVIRFVNHEVRRRYGKLDVILDDDATNRPLRDEAADALRALADAIVDAK